ncbi:MAG: ketoacyl-ACP synthase III [Chloroflexi bacterium]|nr:ketoacyl-ACP synthase III [Chloroflexota bacterium]
MQFTQLARTLMPRYAHITGWGHAVPERVLTNDEIAQMVDTSDEWIRTRTGIRERRIASPDESTATLAARAAEEALRKARVAPTQVDLILVASSTPEYIFPATAALVQDAIGATRAGAADISAACTGFIYALSLAAAMIKAGEIETALVIGAETLSRIVDWEDRNTCILFGDGAGALVLEASDEPGGVITSVLRADGSGADLLILPTCGSRHPVSHEALDQKMHYVKMNGREVFRFATRVMARATREVVEKAGMTLDDIAWIAPHQANRRIIEAAAKSLRRPIDDFLMNLDRYGNTSTASIPLVLYEAAEAGRLKPGDYGVLVGFGAGLTWGAALVQWTGPKAERKPVRLKWYQRLARVRSRLRQWRRTLEGWWVHLLERVHSASWPRPALPLRRGRRGQPRALPRQTEAPGPDAAREQGEAPAEPGAEPRSEREAP